MSPAHCCAVQMAFDRIVEQPTESSPTWDCKQARTRPPPGLTPAQREIKRGWAKPTPAREQHTSLRPPPSCAPALPVAVNSNAAPSAIVGMLSAIMEDDFNMVAFLCVNPTPAGRSKRLARFFSFWLRSLARRTALIID